MVRIVEFKEFKEVVDRDAGGMEGVTVRYLPVVHVDSLYRITGGVLLSYEDWRSNVYYTFIGSVYMFTDAKKELAKLGMINRMDDVSPQKLGSLLSKHYLGIVRKQLSEKAELKWGFITKNCWKPEDVIRLF